MIEQIRKPVEQDFQRYEEAFKEAIHTDNALLKAILTYVRTTKGKELRPVITLLAAGMFGSVNEDTIHAAVSLELLHTASLMHDDVVDQTFERRSKFSVNALWNNRIAILVGDYYLSKSAFITAKMKTRRVTTMLSQLGCDLSDGELLQVSNERKLLIDESAYLDVIRKKTALTFAFCTQAGAISVDANPEQEENLRMFGENLGMVFQIKDDIFDYFPSNLIGKPTGNDLKEGKMTLPLIYALEQSSKEENRPYLNMIRNRNFTPENLTKMSHFVREAGGIEYAEKRMRDFGEMAKKNIEQYPFSSFHESLISCLDYAMKRTK
ncbi:MAG TPA: polyprenyl synthetase family protein [Bacteroidales bacterium]|nr:polyprenyl synthetase family protein [Bacteroidales bacterium]